MDGPVTLLLVVSLTGGEVQPAQLQATLSAYLDPQRVSLTLRGADGVQQLERTLEAASARGPVAVVTNPRRGVLDIRAALRPGQWVSRSLSFSPRDPLTERNRTVALALVAMVPEWKLPTPLPEPAAPATAATVAPLSAADSEPPPDAGPPPLPPLPPLPPPAPPDAGPAPLPALLAAGPADAGSAPPVEVPTAPSPPATPLAPALEVAFVGGYWPLTAGAQVGAHLCFGERLCAGLLLEGQGGTIPEVDARLYRVLPLVTGRVQATLGTERVSGALVLSAGPLWLQAIREDEAQSRWQLSVGLEAEVALRLSGLVSVFVRGGPTVVSGATPIVINDVPVTELPVIVGRLAVGVRFNP